MSLPIYHTGNKDLSLLQTTWATQINPVLDNPLVDGLLLTGVVLSLGSPTTINHKLGRKLQGWILVGINAAAVIYDSQASNQSPQLTLILNSSAACTVSLWVF